MDLPSSIAALREVGLARLHDALPLPFIVDLREATLAAVEEAFLDAGEVEARGARRWTVTLPREGLPRLASLAAHRWVCALTEAVLGRDAGLAAVEAELSYEGAEAEPWHREAVAYPEHYLEWRATGLVFELPLIEAPGGEPWREFALGTQWEDGLLWEDQRVPTPAARVPYGRDTPGWAPAPGELVARSPLLLLRSTAQREPRRLVLQLRVGAT